MHLLAYLEILKVYKPPIMRQRSAEHPQNTPPPPADGILNTVRDVDEIFLALWILER
jgi:hypothetical protein